MKISSINPRKMAIGFLLLIAALIALSSCGTFKKSMNKSKETEHTKTNTETVITRTITEKADTTVTTKESTVQATGDINTLDSGGVIEAENAELSVEVRKDPVTGKVTVRGKAKPQSIHFTVDKKTTEQVVEKKTEVSDKKSFNKVVEKEAHTGPPWWLWLIVILIVLAFVYWGYRKITS